MRQTTQREAARLLAVDIDGLAAMLSCGQATARKIGEDAGARLHRGAGIGRHIAVPDLQHRAHGDVHLAIAFFAPFLGELQHIQDFLLHLHRLDAGGHAHNQQKVDEIIQTIRSELPEVELDGILLGYVSICYLGRPYEVHTLDMTGEIIEHYKAGQTLPNGLEKARGIAMRGGYDFIEVYVDCCRAVSTNGTVSVIPG